MQLATDSTVIDRKGIYVLFVSPDDVEVKAHLFSLQSHGSQNADDIFSAIITALLRRINGK